MTIKQSFAFGTAAILATVLQTTNAAVLNGGFESANFQNWRVNIPRANTGSGNGYRLVGSAQAATSWGASFAMSPLRVAIEGSQFAILSSVANANFTGSRSYNMTLTRQIHLMVGESVSGAAAFYNNSYSDQDNAWVSILDNDGHTIARPWFAETTHLQAVNPSLWTQWSWQAPQDGNYTIGLGLTTRGDDYTPSYGFFDNICVQQATQISSVPEPSVLSLIALGAAGLAAIRRKQQVTCN